MYNNNMNMYNPYQSYLANNVQPQPQHQEVIRVNGKNGAEVYPMAPNSSVLLLDQTAPIVWLKTTDGASYPTITGYQISPIEETQKSSMGIEKYEELEQRIAKLEEILNEKSNVRTTKIIKPTAE